MIASLWLRSLGDRGRPWSKGTSISWKSHGILRMGYENTLPMTGKAGWESALNEKR
jgi:hypothetical protein